MRKVRLFSILILFVFIVTSGFGCKWNPFRSDPELYEEVTLEYWGVWDSPSQLKSLIERYEASHPTIKVNYRNFRYEEYEDKLIKAWAEDRGPDVFAIPADWLKEYQNFIEAMPATHKVPVYTTQGSIKQETVVTLQEFRGLSTNRIKELFVPAVYDKVIIDDEVYGLPYALDTLVTFYNSDLLTQAGIPEPINDFFDLVDQTPSLTKATQDNRIIQSAVALGGTSNVPRFFDIFSSIMLQNGVEAEGKWFMPLEDKESADRLKQAFSFYTDFARPGRASFSWTGDLDNAFEMFASGRLAYFFGYSYHADELRNRNLQFDWGIKNFPQARGVQTTKYYTNFWINVVAKKAKNKNAAWNFVQSTANADNVKKYLEDNKRPTALRALINEQLEDEDISIFASQVLTADTWYNGYNFNLAEQYTGELIDGLVDGTLSLEAEDTLRLFVDRVNQTYIKEDD